MPLLVKPFMPHQQVSAQPLRRAPTSHPIMTAQIAPMNTWEEQAMIVCRPILFSAFFAHKTQSQLSNPQIQDPLIYPGLYSPSGIDILTILVSLFLILPVLSTMCSPPQYHTIPTIYPFHPSFFPTFPPFVYSPFLSLYLPFYLPSNLPLSNPKPPPPLPHLSTHNANHPTPSHTLPNQPQNQNHNPTPPPLTSTPPSSQAAIHTRPNPTVPLGPVDASCALVIADLAQPDHPILYTSQPFTALTGYSAREALGRNCRFLQAPPPPPPTATTATTTTTLRIAAAAASFPGGGGTTAVLGGRERGKRVGGDGNGNGMGAGNGNNVARRRGYGVDMEVVRQMRAAVEMRREVQVEVVNYRKSGEPFLNLLSIIPVRVASRLDRAAGGGGGLDLSVGFLCDVASLE